MNAKKKFCSCGKLIPMNEECSCKKKSRNEYKKEYNKKNKDIHSPLTSTRWKKLRSIIINRDNGCCQRCLVKFSYINSSNLQVHHIKPRIEFPELMFDPNNLLTLCSTCNSQLGTNDLDFKPTTDLDNIDFDFKL